MNRNTFSHFSMAPSVQMNRSRFSRNSNLKTSFNVGDLIPIYCDEVLPGDEFSIKTSKVLRLQTLITPVMDNLWFDVYYFFVPNRLVWSHWQNFMGENSDSEWIPETEYTVPLVSSPSSTGWSVGTIADYFGIPTGVTDIAVNALPFRAYALICNEWFRDQNNSQPLVIPVDDLDQTGSNGGTYVTDVANGGLPFKAAKYMDYFTACLPAPQKGEDVPLPVGDLAPVYAKKDYDVFEVGDYQDVASSIQNYFYDGTSGEWSQTHSANYLQGVTLNGANRLMDATGKQLVSDYAYPSPRNLVADLSLATASSVNALRTAFQIQRLLERDARSGSRYVELLRSHFGVVSPDARLQRPEYLGGNRFPFDVSQVAQTSSTDTTTPQGNLAGFSVTADVNHDFTKAFTEHGFIIGLAVARYEHSYQQGIERFWNRQIRYDYYWPALAHIGEQAVLNQEIFAAGTSDDTEVFGYQEAWADYRYKPNRITGQMRSAANLALDSWHFADDYESLPYLSDSWIREDASNVDRSLAVTSSTANQIFGDIYFETKVTRVMPLYSVPGLIDHF